MDKAIIYASSIQERINILKGQYRFWLDDYKSCCVHAQTRITQASYKDMGTSASDWLRELPEKYAKLEKLEEEISILERILELDTVTASSLLDTGKDHPQGEHPVVLGIIKIVEDLLRQHHIQIPDDLRDDCTDPIVGFTFAELHDNIRDYLVDTAKL